MPVVVAWIGEMLLTVVGQLVISAIVSVGIGFAMHSAGNAAVNYGPIQSMLANAGPITGYIGFFGLDTAMTIVLSAWAGREITEAAKAYITENFHPKLKGQS